MAQERETEPILVKESRPELIKENLHLLHSNASKNYEYVLGCFANSTNAENLYAKLKSSGFAANKSLAGSLIRVSIGATSDLDSLQETISKANNLGYIGWILKK
jgi:cell division septation protein DedD